MCDERLLGGEPEEAGGAAARNVRAGLAEQAETRVIGRDGDKSHRWNVESARWPAVAPPGKVAFVLAGEVGRALGPAIDLDEQGLDSAWAADNTLMI